MYKIKTSAPGILCAVLFVLATGCAHVGGFTESTSEPLTVPASVPVHEDVLEEETPQPVMATVVPGGLRVRMGPGTHHKLSGMLYKADRVEVLEASANGWHLVRGAGGIAGDIEEWVWGPYLLMPEGFLSTIDREGVRYIRLTEDTLLSPDGDLIVYHRFRAPLERVVVNDVFGTRRVHPVNGGLGVMHEGMDLRAETGHSVFAVAEGKVTAVAYHESYGNFLDIEHHGGFSSRYAHLEHVFVKEGQRVVFGQKVALSGNTGRTTGPHLHFELRKGGVAIDPEEHIAMREMQEMKEK